MSKLLALLVRLVVGAAMLRRLVAPGHGHVAVPTGAGTTVTVPGESAARVRVRPSPTAATGAGRSDAAVPHGSVKTIAKGVLKRAQGAYVTDGAAALTYYFVMALVPSLLLCVAVAGLVIDDPNAAFRDVTKFFDIDRAGGLGDAINQLLDTVSRNTTSSSAGLAFVFAIATALWAFSGAMGNLMNGVNRVWGLEETRSVVHRRLLAAGLALATALITAIAVTAVALGGGIAGKIVEKANLGTFGAVLLRVAPFVALLVGLTLYLAVVYWIAPNKETRVFRWITVGAVTGTVVWLLATLGFVLYITTLGSYNKVYGPLAAGVVFLLWLWLSSLSILIGATVDAEIESRTAVGRDQRPTQGVVPDIQA
jgi:membrane protein